MNSFDKKNMLRFMFRMPLKGSSCIFCRSRLNKGVCVIIDLQIKMILFSTFLEMVLKGVVTVSSYIFEWRKIINKIEKIYLNINQKHIINVHLQKLHFQFQLLWMIHFLLQLLTSSILWDELFVVPI